MNKAVEISAARGKRSALQMQLDDVLRKTLTNIEYDRAGLEPPYDDIEIHNQAEAVRAQLKAASEVVTDESAVYAPDLYEPWNGKTDYKQGDRITENGTVYKALQDISANPTWQPSAVPALWQPLANPAEEGTFDNPITAVAGMEYEAGKYYSEGDKVYLCTRSELLHFLPSALVGQYFEEAVYEG